MEDRYHVPFYTRINRRFLKVFFRGFFHLLGKVELYGMENIPDHNKYVAIFNHVSLVEVPFIAAFWPTILEIIGAAAVWDRPGVSIVVKMWSGVRVKRTEFDRDVFKQVIQVFEANRPLMISPEGGRSHSPGLRRGKPGVAYIIDQVDVEVLPVAVVGNTIDFLKKGIRGKRPPIQMIVGEPFKLPPLDGRGEERRLMRQHNTDYIMARLAALLPESYRGVYAEYEKILAGKPVIFPEPED
ncbi:MAG: 1-acyl-sn-glycerol-3-phosphate acyltransferase [Anaerolineales bacterium]|nr:1-acyl-sn-glycerol-3-phosphate acyltransferase [Anaerolineales bacterium]